MWTIPYLVSVLCMQLLARDKKSKSKLEAHSYDKRLMEENVQLWERSIKDNKESIENTERGLSLERKALQGLLPSSPGKWLIIIRGN